SARRGRRDRGRAGRQAAADPEPALQGGRDGRGDAAIHARRGRAVERLDAPARRRRQPRRQGRRLHDRVAARRVFAQRYGADLREHRQRARYRLRDVRRVRRARRGARRRVRRPALLLARRAARGVDRHSRRVLTGAVAAAGVWHAACFRVRSSALGTAMRRSPTLALRARLTAFAAALLAAGCSTAYYQALEAIGIEKRDILVDRVEDARDAQNDAKAQFQSALDQYRSVIGFDGGDLEEVYDRLNGSY